MHILASSQPPPPPLPLPFLLRRFFRSPRTGSLHFKGCIFVHQPSLLPRVSHVSSVLIFVPTTLPTLTCISPHVYVPTTLPTLTCISPHVYVPTTLPTLTCISSHVYVPTTLPTLKSISPHVYVPTTLPTLTCISPHICTHNPPHLTSSLCLSRLEEIGAAASKEYSLEKAMDKMTTEWSDMLFTFIPYRDTVRTLPFGVGDLGRCLISPLAIL